MSLTKLYRQVSVSEHGLPMRSGRYMFILHGGTNNEYSSTIDFNIESGIPFAGITHWLEQVELPDGQDIESEMDTRGFHTAWDRMNGRTMARWLRDLILKGK